MSKHKKQHVIPNCYLKSWCDPHTPSGQTPYIWHIRRDGTAKKKRSPGKSFTETDKYTVKMPSGDRNLVIEKTLAGIESDFVQVLSRIRRREKLNALDRARLCFFTAAMHTRTTVMGEHWKQQQKKLHEMVVALEKQYSAPPVTSLETAEMVEHAHQHLIASGIAVQAPFLFQMQMSIFVTDDEMGFITSDAPCVWFNPRWYELPPLYRSPGLAYSDIEVTLPLSPCHLLLISHHTLPLFIDAPQKAVDEFNRRARFHCTQEFVSWKGETRPSWFDPGKEPEDTWEKSPEGRQALEERKKCEEMRVEHEKWEKEKQASEQSAPE